MTVAQALKQTYGLFAKLLEYPGTDTIEEARGAETSVSGVSPQARSCLERFRKAVEETPQSRLQELYTSTFDLQVVCYPYAGYHLFGESYKRAAFLTKLKELYKAHGFEVEGELPDHIPVILRFLALLDDEDEAGVLVEDGLIPALSSMTKAFLDGANPYGEVVHALLFTLQAGYAREAPAASIQDGKEC